MTYYNKDSIVLNLKPSWRDTSLSANIDVSNNSLRVELPSGVAYNVFCKPFDMDVKRDIENHFVIEQCQTFPTLLALMPNSFLMDEQALKIFRAIDVDLASKQAFIEGKGQGGNSNYGHYVMLVARKNSSALRKHCGA